MELMSLLFLLKVMAAGLNKLNLKGECYEIQEHENPCRKQP